jgi:hypothetical protein
MHFSPKSLKFASAVEEAFLSMAMLGDGFFLQVKHPELLSRSVIVFL